MRLKWKVQASLREKKNTYCQIFKLQFSQNNIFPHVSVCQNSAEIEATDPPNTLDSTNLLAKLLNLCS